MTTIDYCCLLEKGQKGIQNNRLTELLEHFSS